MKEFTNPSYVKAKAKLPDGFEEVFYFAMSQWDCTDEERNAAWKSAMADPKGALRCYQGIWNSHHPDVAKLRAGLK